MSFIISFLQGAGGFLFIFGIVVLVHELGHFLAAKATGVYTPRFSIGFGPGPRKRWGETQYQLGVIPLGGYVRMASREDEATAFLEGGSEASAERGAQDERSRPKDWDPEAMIPFGPKPVPAHRWFESKSYMQRLIILLAGVTMNALLTVGILFGFNLTRGRTVFESRVVGAIYDTPQTQELRTQLLPGDTILSVQGIAVSSWNDVTHAILTAPGETLSIRTHRGTASVAADAPQTSTRARLMEALQRHAPPLIGRVRPGSPADRAGLLERDSVIAIDSLPVRSFYDMVNTVSASPDQDLLFTVQRGADRLDITVRPELQTGTNAATGVAESGGRIGAEPAYNDVFHEEVGVGTALVLGVQQTAEMAGGIVRTVRALFQRKVPLQELAGPIEIAKASAQAAGQGMASLLFLLAVLSINLAILNLLPIPVLDGGQILIITAEAVKGSPFSPRARQYILGTGVALVLLLMLVVSYNDIVRLIRN